MTVRLEEIFSNIPDCKVFADVGCDHGYIAEKMIKTGKCEKVIASDISEKCLSKAKKRLSAYIEKGTAVAVVSDGLADTGVADVVLIAGMGGEEIAGIINSAPFLPETLVLNPMKNADKVRDTLIVSGYKILKDYTFKADKIFYTLTVATKGKDFLTDEEREFGRTNIENRPKDFIEMIKCEIKKLEEFKDAKNIKPESRENIDKRIERLKKYV